MCDCASAPFCQFCKRTIHRCRETVVPYQGKDYHLDCWMKLRNVARRTGGEL